MNDLPSRTTGVFSRSSFTQLLKKPGMAPAMFLPVDRAEWINGRYTLGKNPAPLPAGEFTGVRLLVPDPRNLNKTPEQNFQGDLVQLIESLVRIRGADKELASTVLSSERVLKKDRSGVSRVRFGLRCDANGKFADETAAAAECHRQIVRSFQYALFGIESQPLFDASQGFAGLSTWAKGVRLKKYWDWRWLLALLLLLPFLFRSCRETDPIAGTTRSFIIVVDSSSSMEPHFSKVREEATKTLNNITDSALKRILGFLGQSYYIDLINYDDTAKSLFGQLKPVTTATAKEVLQGIEQLRPGGNTNLKAAMTLAEQEIKKHGRETTVCIITDGADNTVAGMISEMEADRAAVESRFGMSGGSKPLMHVNTLSPRLLDATERTAQTAPQNIAEQQLAQLSSLFYGVFGFTGVGFTQRGLPAFSKTWNTLLWTARMAVIAGVIAYAYPRLRAKV
jgi:hypothetical protein